MSKFHIWRKREDEIICAYVLSNKTDKTTIRAIASLLNLTESQVTFRMSNFIKLYKNNANNWHCSAQERRVFKAMSLI